MLLESGRGLSWMPLFQRSDGALPRRWSGGIMGDARKPYPEAVRPLLGVLLSVGAVNAFIGGSYGMTGAGGLRTDWLERSPFDDYFLPSLILFVLVGGACLAAAIAVLARRRCARLLAQLAGAIVFGFIAVELAIIGPAFWMQSLTAIAAAAIIALARSLPQR
jgi:hypothetical protein